MKKLPRSLLSFVCAALGTAHANQPVAACDNLVYLPADVGHAYHNIVTNSDYNFTIRIPSGLTAWSGTAENAPFHGFSIFMGKGKHRCIVFELHIRLEGEPDARKHTTGAKVVPLGQAKGWQKIYEGSVHGARFYNISTEFSFPQAHQIDDGSIILISTPKDLSRDRQVYEELLDSLKFTPKALK